MSLKIKNESIDDAREIAFEHLYHAAILMNPDVILSLDRELRHQLFIKLSDVSYAKKLVTRIERD